MSKLFKRKKKPYNLRSQKKLYGSSTPKSKVDACVEYDLPFDESEISPELRRVRSPGEREISGVPEARPDIADIVNTMNLEPIDIQRWAQPQRKYQPNCKRTTRRFPESPVYAKRSLRWNRRTGYPWSWRILHQRTYRKRQRKREREREKYRRKQPYSRWPTGTSYKFTC